MKAGMARKAGGAGRNSRPQGGTILPRMLGSTVLVLVLGTLVYLSIFVEPTGKTALVEAPPIEPRDNFFDAARISPGSVLVAGQHGKIVRSDDAGRSWSRQEVPVSAHLISVAAWDGGRAVAVGNGATVLYTTDGGRTWQEGILPENEIGDDAVPREQIKLLKVRTFGNSRAWALGELGLVLRSDDGGQRWRRIDVGEADAWASWNDVDFVGDHGWIVGEFARVVRTVDGGETWSEVPVPVDSSLNAVQFRDMEHGVAVGTSGVIIETADGGMTWSRVPDVTSEHLFDLAWTGRQWLAVGDNGLFLKASADAAEWSAVEHQTNGATWYYAIESVADHYFLVGDQINRVTVDSVVPE